MSLTGTLETYSNISAELDEAQEIIGVINYGDRGARGYGITNVVLNSDNTITFTIGDGTTITTHSIYPIEGNIQWSQVDQKPFTTIGSNLKVVSGALAVDTVDDAIQDNTKPITSGAVYTEIGNIDVLLTSI